MYRIKKRKYHTNLVYVAKVLATWFGTGLLPKAPGTWGSVMALPIGYFIVSWGGPELLVILAILLFIIGIWAANITSNQIGTTDPSEIVIDEVVGQLIVLSVVPPNLIFYLFGFLLFRLFDIVKPWPISWADKQIKGGLGIMLDDVFAALLASILLWIGQFVYHTF